MKRKILGIMIAVVLMIGVGYFLCDALMAEQAEATTQPSLVGQTEPTHEISFMPTRDYQGITYEGRSSNNLTTVLLIGYDHKDNGELIPNQEGYIYGGQSDFLLLLAIDHDRKQVRPLQINRDTITDVKFYSKKGAYYGTRRMQVCLSHAYGDTQEVNNRNAIWAVENLLGIAGEKDGAQIDWYLSMDITGIDRLNDLLGGVTVPINDDFSYYDPTMIQGTTMTLNGAQAQIYCRQRYYIGMQSNEARMERQHIYMKAATEKLAALLRDDSDYAMTLLNGMGLIFDNTQAADDEFDFTSVFGGGTPVTDTPTHYLMTNRSLQSIVSTLMRAMEYEVCDVELLPGEHRIGTSGHMEYIMEEGAGLKWALDTLYTPLN